MEWQWDGNAAFVGMRCVTDCTSKLLLRGIELLTSDCSLLQLIDLPGPIAAIELRAVHKRPLISGIYLRRDALAMRGPLAFF
jgi:hypothetical protein